MSGDTTHAPKKRKRRKRDPQATREALLEAAQEILATSGKEGVSVARVAQRAGANRGTAYQHFRTREQLLEATERWVSDQLYRSVFGDPSVAHDRPVETIDIEELTRRLAEFAMENPELTRIWLFELLSSEQPMNDPFWRQYKSNLEQFSRTEFAQPGIDVEVSSIMMLSTFFIWPIWVRAHARSAKERREMTQRLIDEVLRTSLHGTLRAEKYPELVRKLSK